MGGNVIGMQVDGSKAAENDIFFWKVAAASAFRSKKCLLCDCGCDFGGAHYYCGGSGGGGGRSK